MNVTNLGTCARCDRPAIVAITDAPGNVRCASHAEPIFSEGSMTRTTTGPILEHRPAQATDATPAAGSLLAKLEGLYALCGEQKYGVVRAGLGDLIHSLESAPHLESPDEQEAVSSESLLQQLVDEVRGLNKRLGTSEQSSTKINTSTRGVDVTTHVYAQPGRSVKDAENEAIESYVRTVAAINRKLAAALNGDGNGAASA